MVISRKSIILLIVLSLTVLSTAFAYIVRGAEGAWDPFPDSIVIGSDIGMAVQWSNASYSVDGYVTLTELATTVPLLCSEQGNIEGIFDIEDTGNVDGTKFKPQNAVLDSLFPSGAAYMKDTAVGTKIELTEELYSQIGAGTFTGKALSYYQAAGGGYCSPKEAYILSEIGNLSPHVGIHYELDSTTPVDPDSGYFKFENRFILGDDEFFFGVKKWVTATCSGDALSTGPSGPGSTYEWVKVNRIWGENSGVIASVSKTGVTYTWSEPVSQILFDSGVETTPGSGSGIVPGDVVVHIEGEGYYKCHLVAGGSSIQVAWWSTAAGGGGGVSNALSAEAQAFEDYIYAVSGGSLSRKTATFIDDNGESHTVNGAFAFEYNPSWVTGGEYDNVSVRLEEDNSVVIGPFAIDYFEAHAHVNGRPFVQFAGITKMDLYTDASSEPLKYGENYDWSFVWLDGNRERPGDLKYPKPNEKFYIRIKNIEGATKITDFKVYFKYMNAAGSYMNYQGKYQIQIWKTAKIDVYAMHYEKIVDGKVVKLNPPVWEHDHYEYEFELIDKKEYPAQKLSTSQFGARWYEYCMITRSINIKSGKITITKDIVDNDGNPVNEADPDIWFYFDVKVDGAINSGKSEWLQVQPGKTVESKVYYWLDGSSVPKYTVKEYKVNAYDIVSLQDLTTGRIVEQDTITGELNGTIPVSIKAKNFYENSGRLAIYKKLKDKDVAEVKELIGTDFTFNVTVRGNFKYNNVQYTESEPFTTTVTVKAEGDPWVSPYDFIWYGNQVPTYVVTEQQTVPGTRLVSLEHASGRLLTKHTVNVIATNELIKERGKLVVEKTLQNASTYKGDISKLGFSFIAEVENYPKVEKTIYPIKENDEFIWRWNVGEYEWYYGHNLHYKITEDVDKNPEGTEFVSVSSNTGNTSVSGTSISGRLSADETVKATVENYFVNKITEKIVHYGKLVITKKIEDDTLKDKEFNFVVTVKGTFEYKGVLYEDKTIQLSTDGNAIVIENAETDYNTSVIIKVPDTESTWSSDVFKWYGDENPTYTVEEDVQGQDICFAVTPSRGSLIGCDKLEDLPNNLTKIYAWNRDLSRAGELQIIKKVNNSQYIDIETIKSYKFEFNMWVEKYGDMRVILTEPELENGEWIWRSDKYKFSWNEKDGSPKYKITEIENENGPKFERADNAEGTLIENKLSAIEFKTTEATIYNKVDKKSGTITIEKKSADESLKGKEFTFDVKLEGAFFYNDTFYNEYIIKGVTVKAGEQKVISGIEWYGKAPTYSITENESEIAENINIVNGSGTVGEGNVTVAVFENKVKTTGGYLQVTKHISEGVEFKNDDFTFEIKIAKKGEDLSSVKPTYAIIKANQTYKSAYITWDVTEEAPKYSVREIDIPVGAELVGMTTSNGTVNGDTATGSLLPGSQIVNVVATNKYKKVEDGRFKVIKNIIADEKVIDIANTSFGVKISITGTYEMGGELVVNSTRTIDTVLTIDPKTRQAVYESPVIKYWDKEIPTVTVEETSMPKGWYLVGISNNGNPIKSSKDEELEITVTNRIDIYPVIDITLELAGDVWEDVPENEYDKNTDKSVPNGLYDREREKGLDGVEVYIYDESGNLATIYADLANTPVVQPIITSNGGHWDAPRIKLTENFEKYNVVFVYDGQTYEQTEFLVTSPNRSASDYIKASTTGRDKYANDSMAIEIDRQEVNNRLAVITGNSPINENGDTYGKAIGTDGKESELYYKSMSSFSDMSRKVSILQTVDDNDRIYDIYKTKAGTAIAGLEYPFDKKSHLENYDTKITELGVAQTYYFSATYNYCLHINLGLIKRPEADLGLTKDLYEAKVLVNEQLETYRFNKLADLGADCYTRQFYKDQNDIEYKLGLYTTDYFYRAEMYQSDYGIYDKVQSMYKDIEALRETELEIFLTYKISLYNESQVYDVSIGSIDDYFDSSFGNPITADVYRTVKNNNTKTQVKVAGGSYYNNTPVNWSISEKGIKSSDGVIYNKMTAQLGDVRLMSGEYIDIYVTFKINKAQFKGVHDSIILGNKSNIAEISSYSTYYRDSGAIAGKVDRDSAPGNINIRSYNSLDWYEDDTDSAPQLKLTLEEDTRTVEGTVWEDNDSNDNGYTKGLYDEKEALIGGMTVELIEKIDVDGNEYDFLWPTYKQLDCFGGKTFEELSGFSSITETGRTADKVGKYSFTGIPEGKYIVRFLYGNNKVNLEDTNEITGNAVALKADGTNYSENSDILTANYKKYQLGKTPVIYNGHDYKSAIYQTGFQQVDSNGYLTNKYHDLNNRNLADTRVNDARDSESKRLESISKTRTIMNTTGEVLATANDINASHVELYNTYNMFADTARLDLEKVEAKHYAGLVKENYTLTTGSDGGTTVEKLVTDYKAYNIDFALVERPETEIVLDKQISSIKLITNDNKMIFFADYDIDYEIVKQNSVPTDKTVIARVKEDEYLVAKIELKNTSKGTDQLQALNKNELKLSDTDTKGRKNFRFVNVDSNLLQGITVQIEYLFTVLNVGDLDYTSATLANIEDYPLDGYNVEGREKTPTVKDKIVHLAKEKASIEAKTNVSPEIGKYLGSFYYTGDSSKDEIVTSRVRQLVDYIDNDAVFDQTNNNIENHTWNAALISELKGNGKRENILVGDNVIPEYNALDKDGYDYNTKLKRNIVLSVDSFGDYKETNNSEFQIKIVPYDYYRNLSDNTDISYRSQLKLTTSRVLSSKKDGSDVSFDNLAEIVKLENLVGRRDSAVVPGNANPKGILDNGEETLDEFVSALLERDSSATEVITFMPPTGIESTNVIITEVLVMALVGLTTIAVGIFILKKKVLK